MFEILANPAVAAAVAGAFGTIGGGIAGAFAARWKAAPSIQAVTNEAVAGIIQHYTQALAEQTREVRACRLEIEQLRETVEGQNAEIAWLNNHIIDLSAALERHGVTPPTLRPRLPTPIGG